VTFKFSANLTFLWSELPFLERFDAAAAAGFTGVEYVSPYEYPAPDVKARLNDNGLEQVLFNLPVGDWDAGERGIACDPGRVDEFHASVEKALDYAHTLSTPRLNCLAGLRVEGVAPEVQWSTLVDNVRHAARRFDAAGRRLVVEPINTFDTPGFSLPTTGDALRLLDEVGDSAVQLQFDAYHVQRMEGDVPDRLAAVLNRTGHIQIADAPGRHQPGTGEIDFAAVFALLESSSYAGWVGVEYVPEPSTDESLGWLDSYGLKLDARR
jgi:hydroxypyruvate isomerase